MWLEKSPERPDWEKISPASEKTRTYWAQWNSMLFSDGVLYRQWESVIGNDTRLQLVVPKDLRKTILKHLHDNITSGHFGITKTLQRVKERFYWVGCSEDVKTWCRECDLCNA